MRKIFIVIVLVLCCVLMLAGCNSKMFATPDEDAFTREFLESAERGDYAEHYDDVIGFGSEAEFVETMKGLDDYFNGEIVELKKTGVYFKKQTSNGEIISSKEIQYEIQTTENKYTVGMVFVSEDEVEYKVYFFSIIYTSELAGNGAIIDFEDFDIVQLLLLVFSVLCFAFIIFAIVLCAKSKVRLKGLWIPLIILLQSGVSITNFPEQHAFNVHIFATTMSMLRKFLNGGTILTVMVPLGAILFVALRKKLEARAFEYRQRQEYERQLKLSEQAEAQPPAEQKPQEKDEDF